MNDTIISDPVISGLEQAILKHTKEFVLLLVTDGKPTAEQSHISLEKIAEANIHRTPIMAYLIIGLEYEDAEIYMKRIASDSGGKYIPIVR